MWGGDYGYAVVATEFSVLGYENVLSLVCSILSAAIVMLVGRLSITTILNCTMLHSGS